MGFDVRYSARFGLASFESLRLVVGRLEHLADLLVVQRSLALAEYSLAAWLAPAPLGPGQAQSAWPLGPGPAQSGQSGLSCSPPPHPPPQDKRPCR